MCGHTHTRDVTQVPMGMTTLTEYTAPSAQNWLNPTTNPFSPAACGFYVWCITNGTVLGVVQGVLTNYTYYPLVVNTNRTAYPELYDGLTNVFVHGRGGAISTRDDYHVSVLQAGT